MERDQWGQVAASRASQLLCCVCTPAGASGCLALERLRRPWPGVVTAPTGEAPGQQDGVSAPRPRTCATLPLTVCCRTAFTADG